MKLRGIFSSGEETLLLDSPEITPSFGAAEPAICGTWNTLIKGMHLSQKGNMHCLRPRKKQNQTAALAKQSLKLSLSLQHSIIKSVFRQSGMIIISKNDIL